MLLEDSDVPQPVFRRNRRLWQKRGSFFEEHFCALLQEFKPKTYFATDTRYAILLAMSLLAGVVTAESQSKDSALHQNASASSDGNWACWRGPNRNSVADWRNLPIRWSPTENIRWSVQLPGWGTSSPVVYGGRVFVTSQQGEGGKKSLLTLCYDRRSGKELWRHDFGFGVDQHTHKKSNLAVNTPAVTEDAVYVAFGNADIARYSHDGKLAWVTTSPSAAKASP